MRPRALAGCLAASFLLPPTANALQPDPAQQARVALGLRDCLLLPLAIDTTPQQPLRTALVVGGARWTLNLTPYSVRDPEYHVIEQRADGSYVEVKAEPINTLRGFVEEIPGSLVAGGVMPDGLHATIRLETGEQYWLEPLGTRVAGAAPGTHVLYLSGDVAAAAQCGTDERLHRIDEPLADELPPGPSERGHSLYTAQVAVDCDYQYYGLYGSTAQVQNRVNLLYNVINVQYERDVDVTHAITTIIVRTAEPDPYNAPGTGELLNQFRDYWNANLDSVVRDVAHLFTGYPYQDVIGTAYLAQICSDTYAYGVSRVEWNNFNLSSATDVIAHEMGHNWSAPHCSCVSPAFTMNSWITSINRFKASGADADIPTIINHRNSRTCLTTGPGGIDPRNDACSSAVPIGPGTIAFSNIGATTDGPAACGFFGADIWYYYIAPCNGEFTINTCGSAFDTTLAAYTGVCGGLTPVACDDDEPTCGASGLQSALTFNVTRGTRYYIRAGGYNGAIGSGQITLSQTGCPVPPNDLCSSAIDVGQDPVPFATYGASTDGPLESGCNFSGYAQLGSDVWFRYRAPCSSQLRISLCGSSYDTKLAVYTGCPLSPNLALACNDDTNNCGLDSLQSQVTIASSANVVYYIRIGGWWGAQGTGILAVSSLSCPAPPNDACGNAITAQIGQVFSGTLVGATRDGSTTCPAAMPDAWYSFTARCDGRLTVSTCGTHDLGGIDSGMDTVISVHSGCPGTGSNQLACNDNAAGNPCGDAGLVRDSLVSIDLMDGQVVKVRVAPHASDLPGPYLVRFGFTQLNDACATAAGAVSGATQVCNYGATLDGPAGCRVGYSDIWFRYTAPCTGTAAVNVCDADFDSVLFAYSGIACPATALRQIACVDDNCGTLASRITFPVTSGAAYLLRIASFSSIGGQGTATMNISCAPASCPCDFDRSGILNSADFFVFLSEFFSGDPAADFDGSGIVNSADFFAFLNCFFAPPVGC